MDRESLYDLRSLLALYPYYQTARLLMLQNLYLLHDPTFDEELRRAAIYITDRKVIFQLIESAHYQLRQEHNHKNEHKDRPTEDRTSALIDDFLDSIPVEDEDEKKKGSKRKPTPADAAVDYVSYLLETESEEERNDTDVPLMKGQELIDDFINNDKGNFTLQDEPEYKPEIEDSGQEAATSADESYFTETLAKIYIKQQRYEKALEIIQRLNLNNTKKNAYFADQIRFLKKLIINNSKKQ